MYVIATVSESYINSYFTVEAHKITYMQYKNGTVYLNGRKLINYNKKHTMCKKYNKLYGFDTQYHDDIVYNYTPDMDGMNHNEYDDDARIYGNRRTTNKQIKLTLRTASKYSITESYYYDTGEFYPIIKDGLPYNLIEFDIRGYLKPSDYLHRYSLIYNAK